MFFSPLVLQRTINHSATCYIVMQCGAENTTRTGYDRRNIRTPATQPEIVKERKTEDKETKKRNTISRKKEKKQRKKEKHESKNTKTNTPKTIDT